MKNVFVVNSRYFHIVITVKNYVNGEFVTGEKEYFLSRHSLEGVELNDYPERHVILTFSNNVKFFYSEINLPNGAGNIDAFVDFVVSMMPTLS